MKSIIGGRSVPCESGSYTRLLEDVKPEGAEAAGTGRDGGWHCNVKNEK